MNIDTFMKAYTLWATANNSNVQIMVSNVNQDNTVTEDSMESQIEYRLLNSESGINEPIEKPAEVTWSAIQAYKTAAGEVADYSN